MSKKGRYVELIRLHILVNCMELLWRQPCNDPVAPCVIKEGEERRKKRDKFYIYSDVAHTHTPGRSRVNPERQEEGKKTDTTTGKKPEQRRGGGERTDLQNKPTRRNGPDQKQSTHLNPTTHYGEARGEIRDQMGD